MIEKKYKIKQKMFQCVKKNMTWKTAQLSWPNFLVQDRSKTNYRKKLCDGCLTEVSKDQKLLQQKVMQSL